MDTVIELGSEIEQNVTSTVNDLQKYLQKWDEKYKIEAKKIELFNRDMVVKWTNQQRINFIKSFYHSRGHFSGFLWHLGLFAPDKISKDIVLENISEEFNGYGPSHEQLYLDFAMKEGIDLSNEYIENKFYTIRMKKFNDLHMTWLYSHKVWDSKLAAFSAYERLDSTDYELLSTALFQNAQEEHIFFKIHREAEHFDKTFASLLNAWKKNEHLVREAFHFIGSTQLRMWKDLSNEVFSESRSYTCQ